jgi:hypothetical protein
MIPLLAPRARVLCPDLGGFGRAVLALLDALGLERVDRWV